VLREEWPGVTFIGFDPLPAIDPKSYDGTLIKKALGAGETTATLHVPRRHKDGSSLHKFIDQETTNTVEVDVTTLDLHFPQRPTTGKILLWLDCEGHELRVLWGANKFLDWVDVVNVELTARPPSDDWSSPTLVYKLLQRRGFWMQWIHSQHIHIGQSDAIFCRQHIFNPSRCCVPQEILRWNEFHQRS
jgi:hypothetical protein